MQLKVYQVFEWKGTDGKLRRFFVDAALVLIEKEKPDKQVFPLALVQEAIRLNFEPEVKEEVIATADLSKPIIIITLEDGTNIVADGWHRVLRAAREGKDLFAYVLNWEQTRRCEIR